MKVNNAYVEELSWSLVIFLVLVFLFSFVALCANDGEYGKERGR